jgi:hypothetical protein
VTYPQSTAYSSVGVTQQGADWKASVRFGMRSDGRVGVSVRSGGRFGSDVHATAKVKQIA